MKRGVLQKPLLSLHELLLEELQLLVAPQLLHLQEPRRASTKVPLFRGPHRARLCMEHSPGGTLGENLPVGINCMGDDDQLDLDWKVFKGEERSR